MEGLEEAERVITLQESLDEVQQVATWVTQIKVRKCKDVFEVGRRQKCEGVMLSDLIEEVPDGEVGPQPLHEVRLAHQVLGGAAQCNVLCALCTLQVPLGLYFTVHSVHCILYSTVQYSVQ